MKCSRCGTELTGLLSNQCPKVSCLGNVPEPSVKRKPIQWHPPTEKPDTQYRFWVVTLYGDVYLRATYADPRFHVAWAYESEIVDLKALAIDARDAMEGE